MLCDYVEIEYHTNGNPCTTWDTNNISPHTDHHTELYISTVITSHAVTLTYISKH